jgi:putative hydrolase of the HAD superfamily
MIETITFDLWNTLFQDKSYSKSRIDYITEFLKKKSKNLDRNFVKNCYDFIFQYYEVEEINEIYPHIYTIDRIEKLENCLKIILSENEKNEILIEIENAMLEDPPSLKIGARQTLEELNQKYKIGLISNTGISPGKVIKKVMEKYDILKYFKITIFSDEVGYYKPTKILFHKVLNYLESRPEKSIHVGDLLNTDIKGAKDCGMMSIWLNDINQERIPNIIPDFEIKKIKEIIDIVRKL